MGSKLICFEGLFCPAANPRLQEKQLGKESNLSLELSLSCDYSCNNVTDYDVGKEKIYSDVEKSIISSNQSQSQRKEHKMKMKNKSQGLSSELSGISLELSLWDYPREKNKAAKNHRHKPKVEGFALQQPTLGFKETCSTSKKRERKENSGAEKVSFGGRNKRIKAERRVGLDIDDPWVIKKKLSRSDINVGLSRLLLASECVESHILPFWNADQIAKIKEGLLFTVLDCNKMTEHEIVFKKWNNGANVLMKNWVKDFVKRRELKIGDEIGLYWDNDCSIFKFAVLDDQAAS